MATQYIKYVKKCEKMFFPNYGGGGGHGSFWPGGGYAHVPWHNNIRTTIANNITKIMKWGKFSIFLVIQQVFNRISMQKF